MLGIRLSTEDEAKLDRFAREVQRPKSALARDWILERLNRESIDEMMRKEAKLLALHYRPEEDIEADWDDD